jgi:hypothetical protein
MLRLRLFAALAIVAFIAAPLAAEERPLRTLIDTEIRAAWPPLRAVDAARFLWIGGTDGLKAHKYDVKWLIRELVNSQAYQAAGTGEVREALPYWYERARVRPLSAEELLAAFQTATGFDRLGEKIGGDTQAYVMQYFGEPSDGRGDFQANLGEHLFLNNSEQLKRMIQPRKGNLADTLLKSKESPEERVDRLFLSVLSRPPRSEERKRFVAYLATPGARPEALIEEAVWVLLNTAEFRFNR